MITIAEFNNLIKRNKATLHSPEETMADSDEKLECILYWYTFPFNKAEEKNIREAIVKHDWNTIFEQYRDVQFAGYPNISVYSPQLEDFVGTIKLGPDTLQYVDDQDSENG